MRNILLAVFLATGSGQAAAADGDAAAGEKVFKKCAACHAVEEGKKKVGPTMFGIWGRPAGAVEGYKYSSAMQEAEFSWDEEQLTGFLAAPKKHLPGTKMAFPGLKKEQQISDLLAYLKTLN
ncbi:cytochrome c family protein [Phaeobacter inhibens]|uniref:c-type cytochrome n=1 Tax=Phaeobacter inhibens TaxID=221822 RepID=UPI000160DBFD|nr:cytochrome c family protein [Phaeobacter inhibens]AFO88318.1 putative cytochrome c [Phaeobacter inhibens 2.10]AXT43069.1 cytochrome c family protein [Phaeobacter inhibens]